MACLIVFPIGEALTCGIMQMIASIVSSGLAFGVSGLLTVSGPGYSDGRWLAVYMFVAACILAAFFGVTTRQPDVGNL